MELETLTMIIHASEMNHQRQGLESFWVGDEKWSISCHINRQVCYSHQWDSSLPGHSGRSRIPRELAAMRLQLLPTAITEDLGEGDVRNAGYWPQIAEMNMKGMISGSPDPCIFPFVEER